MYLDRPSPASRLRAALPALVVHVLLALILIYGLAGTPPAPDDPPLRLVTIAPPPPLPDQPPPPPPLVKAGGEARAPAAQPEPEGAAAPPNLKAEPAPIVAPEPIQQLPPPPPTVAAAPVAGTGAASSAGAAPIRGPGTGAGGLGIGRGSGGGGMGPGGGGGGDGGPGAGIVARPPRWTCCDLSIRDVPQAIQERTRPGISVVSVIYTVETDGRVTGCRVSRSSGNRDLDQITCRLVEQRYRFRPALNPYGRPVRAVGVGDDHEWMFEQERDDGPPRRRRGW